MFIGGPCKEAASGRRGCCGVSAGLVCGFSCFLSVVGVVCSLCSGLFFCSGCAALGFMCFFQVVGSGCTESQQAGLNKDLTVGPVRFFAYVLN